MAEKQEPHYGEDSGQDPHYGEEGAPGAAEESQGPEGSAATADPRGTARDVPEDADGGGSAGADPG
jgi:hypothetical protein